MKQTLHSDVARLPEGYSEGLYDGKPYGIVKTLFNQGRSCKVVARELGGRDFISLNYFPSLGAGALKPCEMSERKVTDFLRRVEPTANRSIDAADKRSNLWKAKHST